MTEAVLVSNPLRYRSREAGAIRGLVAVLHGVGSSGSAMAPLAEQLARAVPNLMTVAPDAPDRFDGGELGRQWFSVEGVNDANRPARIAAALPAIRDMLNRELDRAGLGWDRLAVVGFSQGAMMALALAADARPPAAVAAIAGRLASPVAPTARRRPPVLILHGEIDEIVPAACAEQAASTLRAAGFSVETEIATGLGHGLTDVQAQRVIRHLADAFAAVGPDRPG